MSVRYYSKGRKKVGSMNKTETAYQRHLESLTDVMWFKYEGLKLRLADNTFYTPDFFLMRANGELEVHEVKGSPRVFLEASKVKVKVAADIYPFRFYVAYPTKGAWSVEEVA